MTNLRQKYHPLIFLILLLPVSSTASEVLFIHSYHLDYPWVKEYRQGFLDNVKTNNVIEHQMDTKRIAETQFNQAADDAIAMIGLVSPKIVVIADDNALRLVGPVVVQKNIPLIFLGINNNPRNYIKLSNNISGALERPLLKRSVSSLKSLLPETSSILVMMDNNPTSYAILATSFDNKFKQTIAGINVETQLFETFDDWQSALKQSKTKGFDAVIIANYAALRNKIGQNVSLDEVSQWTSAHSPVPLFAFWDYSIGKDKAIGGLTINGYQQGAEAANKANHFFKYGSLPSISTPNRGELVYSQAQLDKWQISLPENIKRRAKLVP
ncbi:ABC transporter substrate-binding protein [Shewanella waksmanii]|uniref:ABC transporter substrate-binding protein n=1 Tax=Shewanella waksmanii TaxID=213783 RepID=UPI003734D76D